MSSETPAAESSGSTKATSACVVGTLACRSTMARDHGHPTSSGRPAGFYGGSTTAVGGNQWYQQRLGTANEIAVVPAAEGPAWNPQPVQRFAGWQMGLLDEIDDLELFRCGIPHSCSSPSAIMLFFEQTVFQRQINDAFFQRTGLTAQILDLIADGGTCRIASQASLAGLHELFRPGDSLWSRARP